jgi:dual specificity tyrosine-phosphorylation-regulated kinase 2/3/4
MRDSKPSFTTYVRNSIPYPPETDAPKFLPAPPKPRPPVPTLQIRFDAPFDGGENEAQKRNPRNARVAKSARAANPRFQRAFGGSGRDRPSLSPVVSGAPINPAEARAKYGTLLNSYEMEEIREYPEVYFVGNQGRKYRPNQTGASNYGYDDASHHYRCNVGDHIAYRYEIRSILGKGAFGQVLRCFDHKVQAHVALKLIINTEQMHDQGKVETAILQQLNEAGRGEKSYVVKGLDFFTFRRHICVTFEILGANLYEYSRSMRYRPLESQQMKSIALAMLKGLAFVHRQGIIHCDMKPENVLLTAGSTNDVRIIDFGSSCLLGRQRYEYIQSRFYRAPEVILGLRYGPPMDIWSFACIVAEMMAGRPLFPGSDEGEQMQMLMEVLGPPPRAMIEKSNRKKHFFGLDGRPVMTSRRRRVGGSTLRMSTGIRDNLLLDLLDKCLEWDPTKRITAADALNHAWFAVREIGSARKAYPVSGVRWR